MNLYFRLITLLLKILFIKKEKNILNPQCITLHIYPNDLDINFHVNNGRLLTLLDLGRFHLMGINGVLKVLWKNKWFPVVGSVKVHFLKPLFLFDKIKLTTQIIYWDDKWIYLEQKIFKKEELCATALIKGLFLTKEAKIPTEAILNLFPTVEKPPFPPSLQAWLEVERKIQK